jgi:hypothetical protein
MIFEGHNTSWGESGRWGLWVANTHGGKPRPLELETSGRPLALSPNGRSIAFGVDSKLKTADLSGGGSQTIYTAASGDAIRSPRYSADSQKLIFFVDEGANGRIDTINPDGTDRETIVTGLNSHHVTPGFSPDDTKILYTGVADDGTIVVANSDGSEPKAIETGLEHAVEARFSPDGTKIAFEGCSTTTKGEGEIENENQIFTIDTNGTHLTQVAYDEFADTPEWMPGGERVGYTAYKDGLPEQTYSSKADGSGDELLLEQEPAGFAYTRLAAWPAGTVPDDEYLGLNYAPILRFDSTEKWRPLNVEAFLGEKAPGEEDHGYNKVCTESGCQELGSEWKSVLAGSETQEGPRYIEMGEWPEELYPYPTSPNASCYTEVFVTLWDCDSGPRTAIYYHVVPSADLEETSELGYNYVDYWMFYRYNQDQNDPSSTDDHQGDWEGLTVAPSLITPNALDFVIFAQHSHHYLYAPGNLQCDAGGEGSCGTGEDPIGQRVWDFVAVGTHASYPAVDSGGESGVCTQTDEELPEGCHDGAAPWGATRDVNDVLPFPEVPGEGDWIDWSGRWGKDTGSLVPKTGASPDSPSDQSRFRCPWQWYEPETTACPSSAHGSPAHARDIVASTCGNWFGGSVVMTACSPSALRNAVHAARMGRSGKVHIEIGRRAGHSASLPGVAQALGEPLRSGETVTVAGPAPIDTKLLVRAEGDGRLVEAAFAHLGLKRGGRGTVRVIHGHAGIHLVWIEPDGRTDFPIKLHTTWLPVQHRAARHAAHAGTEKCRLHNAHKCGVVDIGTG